MAAPILLVSRFPLAAESGRKLAPVLQDDENTRYFFDLDQNELLQLRAYESLADLAAGDSALALDVQRFAAHMIGDVRREILDFVEAPKNCTALLPQTDYVQLRHVEVPPARHAAYRRWREETIFGVVRKSDEIEVFLAYHSVVSGQPGVMFISGFSAEVGRYQSIFDSAEYKQIVREAGDLYITGGKDGLYTRIYAGVNRAPRRGDRPYIVNQLAA